jgi:hypothetical protein
MLQGQERSMKTGSANDRCLCVHEISSPCPDEVTGVNRIVRCF